MTTYSPTYKTALDSNRKTAPTAASPFNWLRDGWNDFVGAPAISIMLGSAFTAVCVAAYAAAAALPVLSGTVLSLLLLVSPFIAAAAYYVAQHREQFRTVSLPAILRSVRSRAIAIGLFSLIAALVVGAWVRLSSIAFALYYGAAGDVSAQLAHAWTTGFDHPTIPVFLTAAGILLGSVLFAIGAMALPMIADRDCNAVTAIHKSLLTLRDNKMTMLFWMMTVIAYLAVAILSGLVLMPVVFPLLAYATWHSYRELSESSRS